MSLSERVHDLKPAEALEVRDIPGIKRVDAVTAKRHLLLGARRVGGVSSSPETANYLASAPGNIGAVFYAAAAVCVIASLLFTVLTLRTARTATGGPA